MKHKHKKRFGQNFLNDKNIIEKIVKSISPSASDQLIEIGPGQGAITFPVLSISRSLTAIEIDNSLIPHLQKDKPENTELSIIESDALKVDLNKIYKDSASIRVFGNLPYNISTPLIFHLLKYKNIINDMHFMLQKEVIERIVAEPGSKTYGRLSIMVQYHCRAENLFLIGPNSFYPPPKVDSAFVRLTPYTSSPYDCVNYEIFSDIVRKCFNARRKTIRNSLKNDLSADQIEECKISPSARPETLAVSDFVTLANMISKQTLCQ